MNPQRAEVEHDHSRSFHQLRPTIVDSRGLRYGDFLKTLSPRYRQLYRDIGLGYAALIATCILVIALPAHRLLSSPLAAGLGALSIGFWVAYLNLFIHEGAHFNFSSDPAHSDQVCNLLISWIMGMPVQRYRTVHFQHHRLLGSVHDSERTYFLPLNPPFVAKGLLGVRALEVLMSRRTLLEKAAARDVRDVHFRLAAVAVHLLTLAAMYVFGSIWLTAAWIVGIGAVFPFLGALRQLLEHRDGRAKSDVNYFDTNHGAYTRVFGTGPFSSTFGGAGFNRHLLHHWEPSVSYTNLPELELYLLDTTAARLIEMRRSSYLQTFVSLFRIR